LRTGRHVAALLAVSALAIGLLSWLAPGPLPHVEDEEPQLPVSTRVSPAKPTGPIQPFAQWTRGDIPANLLALVGKPEEVPQHLVAVLGDARYILTGARVGGMATDPGGRSLAVSCGTDLFLFDVETGRQVRRIPTPAAQLTQLAFGPRGDRLVTGSEDGIVRLWEVATGRLLRTFEGHTGPVWTVAFDGDDRTIVSGSADHTLRVWDAGKDAAVWQFDHPDHVVGVALTPNGKRLASACVDGFIRVWDRPDYDMREPIKVHGDSMPGVAFSRDGRWLITGGSKALKVLDAKSLELSLTLPGKGSWIGFGADGRTLLAAAERYEDSENYIVSRWELATGKKLVPLKLESRGGIGAFTLTPDGKTLFAVRTRRADSRYVRGYDTDTGELRFPEPTGHRGRVTAVAFSRDDAWLASGSQDHSVRLWHLAGRHEGEPMPPVRMLRGHSLPVTSVCFRLDGKLLASGSLDQTIIVWNPATGKALQTLKGHSSKPSRIAFSPDGGTIAAGLDDGAVRFWDAASGSEKQVLAGHAGAVSCVAYSPDGRRIVSASADQTLLVRDSATAARVQKFDLPGPADVVAFTSDGKRLLATLEHKGRSVLAVWDVDTWQRTDYPSDQPETSALALSARSPLIAIGGNGSLHLRDLQDATPQVMTLATSLWCDGPADACFSHDGQRLATANANGTVTIFDLKQAVSLLR
jgi:WD40 repeat protein